MLGKRTRVVFQILIAAVMVIFVFGGIFQTLMFLI